MSDEHAERAYEDSGAMDRDVDARREAVIERSARLRHHTREAGAVFVIETIDGVGGVPRALVFERQDDAVSLGIGPFNDAAASHLYLMNLDDLREQLVQAGIIEMQGPTA